MGMIVTEQIKPHANIDLTDWPGPRCPKIGMNPRYWTIQRAGAACALEMTSRPQNP